MITAPGKNIILDEIHVGSRRVFEARVQPGAPPDEAARRDAYRPRDRRMMAEAHTPVSPSWDHLATASDTGAVGACRNASRTRSAAIFASGCP